MKPQTVNCKSKKEHMKRTLLSLIFALFLVGNSLFAQEQTEEFKPSARPVITVFANYHAGLGSNNDLSGFELNRAYLGYTFELAPDLSGSAVLDAAVSSAEKSGESQQREVYIKNVFLTWKKNNFILNGGLVKTLQFALTEKFWGYRYVAASFQDMYKMGPSADLGLTGEYKITSWLTADLSLINGEGYKNLNMDNRYRYGAGISANPTPEIFVRFYSDLYRLKEKEKNQTTIALFAGYQNKYFSLGTEYNYQKNNNCINGNDFYGFSAYTTVFLNKKWKVFARFDYIDSKDIKNQVWNSNSGNMLLAGVEYMPIKQLKIAPTFKHSKSYDATEMSYNNAQTIYCNVGFFW